MNKYGLTAQEHWKNHAPSRYASLENPEQFFEELGESVATQVDATASTLERQLPPDLPYLERVGQMNAIRRQAEETAMTDLVYSVETEPSTLQDELERMLGDLPTATSIRTTIDRVWEDAENAMETGDSSRVLLTEDQATTVEQLTALLPLVSVNVDEMTEAELRDRILALRPFWNPETHSLAQP